jgi:stage III sporulation protein AD
VNLFAICGLAILGLIVTVILRGARPDFAVFSGIATALVLLGVSISSMASVVNIITKLSDETGFSLYTTMILKTLGIALVSQVTADVCRDCGFASIASKVEFSAKLMILSLCIPILQTLLDYIVGFLG